MQRKRTSKKSAPANQLHKGAEKKLPADDGEESGPVPVSLGARAEQVWRSIDGRSLMTHNYTSLPLENKHYSLSGIIATLPGAYSEMIGRVMAGSSLKSACTVIGINYNQLYNWLREGADDFYRNEDTYCARLFNDVRIATAHATGMVEMALAADPKSMFKWLERGPGKQFHSDTGLWQPPAQAQPQLDSPIDPLPLVDASSTPDHIPADSIMGEAIKHLEALHISTNPEFAKQLQEQYRITGKPSADAS